MKKPNIVWFEIDSLRPDFLAAHGDDSVAPTFIDELVKKGASFTQCISAAPFTIVSENSMLTGFYPSVNKLDGWFKNSPQDLDKNIVTLTDVLKAEEYFTACFYPTRLRPYIPPYSFDLYDITDKTGDYSIDRYLSVESPKFMFLDIETIHDTCCANRGTFTKQKYCEAVKNVAEEFRRFYDKCCSEEDIIVITSDHGIRIIDEPANEQHKDEYVTGNYLTDKTLKSFFLIIAGGRMAPGIKINKMVRTVDIIPTVLDVAGLPVIKAQGISLLPYVNNPGQMTELKAYSVTGGMNSSPWKPDTWSIRTSKWKLVVTKIKKNIFTRTSYKKELYNMKDDPYELKNRIKEFPETAEKLFKDLEEKSIKNDDSVKNIYEANDFDYKKYLNKRFYPVLFRLRMRLLTLFRYKMNYRFKIQLHLWSRKFFMKNIIKKVVMRFREKKGYSR